ncbi:MAG TPA: hypothetical protein VGA71_02600, partial [Actinomycetota bacterium]
MSTSEPSLRLAAGTDAASTLIDSTDSLGSVRTDQKLPGPPPHGGRLTSRLAHPDVRDRWLDKVAHLPSVTLTAREVADIECLAVGAFSPLEGFLGKADYESVVADMRLASGLVWSLPVTLAATADEVLGLKTGGDVVL